MNDLTNKGIEQMANDTINRFDSDTGRIVHIAAFKSGIYWYRETLREQIKTEISDLESEGISWRDQNCQQLAHNCRIRVTALQGVLEMMNDDHDCEFCGGAGEVSRDSDGRAVEYKCTFCNGTGKHQ